MDATRIRAQRIWLVGSSGVGRTTLARELERRTGLPYTSLDDLYWRPDWVKAPTDAFRAEVERELAARRHVRLRSDAEIAAFLEAFGSDIVPSERADEQ